MRRRALRRHPMKSASSRTIWNRSRELLTEVQTAYGKEDYATLRRLTTPEAMSYLAEELGQNATDGLRNSVSDVKLLQADIAEAWAEGDAQYATTAMRYSERRCHARPRRPGVSSRATKESPRRPPRSGPSCARANSDWKLSAIQDAA